MEESITQTPPSTLPSAIHIFRPAFAALAARVLVEAVARRPDGDTEATIYELAREVGIKIAKDELRASNESDRDTMRQLLTERGYEPRSDASGTSWLRNCVFDELANQQGQLVCGMNLSLVKGMLEALPGAKMMARHEPEGGRCCVVLTSSQPSAQSNG